MASIKIDFSKVKHLKSDKDTTTLQHQDGHTITLRHKSLDPENQKQLLMLSGHAHRMADGGELSGDYKQHPTKLEDVPDAPGVPSFNDPQRMHQAEDNLNARLKSQTPPTPSAPSPAADEPEAPVPASKYPPPQGLAEGGDVKEVPESRHPYKHETGVHRDYDTGSTPGTRTSGQSLMGLNVRGKEHPKYAKAIHERVRAQQAEIKPKLQGLANGGHVEGDSCPMCGGGMPTMYAEGGQQDEQPQAQDVTDQTQPEGQNTVLAPQPQVQSQDQNPGIGAANLATPNYSDPNEATGQPAGTDSTLAPASADATPNQPQPPQAPKQIAPPTPIQQLQQTKEQTVQTMQQEVNNFDNDLYKGHIQPQTYASLFADKSTLGKIGTMFGMLLSGAGSGMAHQPNALLSMMDNQISNDLKAQTQSAANVQNFYRLHQQDQMNKANIANIGQDTKIKAYTLAQANMLQASYHTLVQNTAKMPEGPLKQQAQATLAMLYQKIGDKINNSVDAAAGASAYNQMLFGNQPQNSPNADQETQFKNRVQGLRVMGNPQTNAMADSLEQHHIPGIPGQSSQPVPQATRDKLQAMNVLDAKGKDVLNYVNQHTGTWNPQTRAVAQQKIEEMKNFYNGSINGGALTEGRLGWYDQQFAKNPTDILNQLMGSTAKLKEVINSNAARRDSELKNLGFPETKTDKNGNRFMRGPKGEAIPIK